MLASCLLQISWTLQWNLWWRDTTETGHVWPYMTGVFSCHRPSFRIAPHIWTSPNIDSECVYFMWILYISPQWEAADAEIKSHLVKTELKRSPIQTLSRLVYSHTRYAYCQGFSLLISALPVHSPAFFQNLSRFPMCWLWLTHGSCVGPKNEICHPAGCRFPCWVPAEYK